MATYSLNPGTQMFIHNYLLSPPPYHHHIPFTPSSSCFYPPLPLPYYKSHSAPPPTAITTYSFPSCATIPVFSTSTATCPPANFPNYYKSSLGPDWFESVNQYPSLSQPYSHTSRFQTSDHQYGSISVAAEEADKNVVVEEKLEKPHQANDFHVKAKEEKNIPPRLGGSHQHQHHHRQSYFRSNQIKRMIWKPKSAISGETGRISTVNHDKIMEMLLPSKKIVAESSDASNDQVANNNTTLMIRNIPSKYTRQMLTNLLEDHCKEANKMRATDQSEEEKELSAFDFLYLPIDFERGFNRGYAFVNMTNSTGANRLRLFLNNYKWGVFQSKKICQVTDAKYQGKEALVTHFQCRYFECESDELLPRCFSPYRDGSGVLVEESTVGRFCGQRHHQNDN